MEITESTIYWITRLDKFHVTAGLLLGISLMVLLICIVFCCVQKNELNERYIRKEEEERIKREMKIAIKIACYAVFFIAMCASVLVFVPTSKEMALIKVIPAISNSKFVSDELPKGVKEIYELAKDAIKNRIEGNEK